MQVRKLTGLEINKIQNERDDLTLKKTKYEELVTESSKMDQLIM